jgi:hypothetical protein
MNMGKKRLVIEIPDQDYADMDRLCRVLSLKRSTLFLAGLQCLAYQEFTRAENVLKSPHLTEGLPDEEAKRMKGKAAVAKDLWNNFFADWIENYKRGGEIHTSDAKSSDFQEGQ